MGYQIPRQRNPVLTEAWCVWYFGAGGRLIVQCNQWIDGCGILSHVT